MSQSAASRWLLPSSCILPAPSQPHGQAAPCPHTQPPPWGQTLATLQQLLPVYLATGAKLPTVHKHPTHPERGQHPDRREISICSAPSRDVTFYTQLIHSEMGWEEDGTFIGWDTRGQSHSWEPPADFREVSPG